MDELLMRVAIDEARASLREGNHGFGAMVGRDGEIVARAHDREESDGLGAADRPRQRRPSPVARFLTAVVAGLLLCGPSASGAHAAELRQPERTTPVGMTTVEVTGTVRAIVSDDFRGRTAESWALETATGWIALRFGPGTSAPPPGSVVRVAGSRLGDGALVAASVTPLSRATGSRQTGRVAPATASAHRIAVIIADFTDVAGDPATTADADATFTGLGSTVQAFYATTSRGRMTTTSTVYGPWSLGIASTCDPDTVWNAGDALAVTHGVDLSAYEHVVIWTRRPACAWWAGVGTLPGSRVWLTQDFPTWMPDPEATMTSIVAHELGHNLGLEHATAYECVDPGGTQETVGGTCTASEYGDPLSTMGDGYEFEAIFDSDELQFLGWLDPDEAAKVTSVGTYDLVPTYATSSGVRLMRIPRRSPGVGLNAGYWTLEIRSVLASPFDQFDPFFTTATTGVTIRFIEAWPPDGWTSSRSYLVDTTPTGTAPSSGVFEDAPLVAGASFADTAGGLTFHVDAVSSSGAAVTIGDTEAPSAPGTLTATPSAGGIYLAWGAATDNLGLAAYEIRRDGAPFATVSASTLAYDDSTAASGAAHTYEVVARDSAGLSGPGASATATMPSVPGAPTSVAAVAGNAQAQVSWTAPGSDGSSPITGYTVTSSPGGKTCVPVPAIGTSCVVTGLTNGQPYTFTVTATNGVGTGLASEPSALVTPAIPLTARISPLPTYLASTSVKVSWGATAGTSPLASYDVRVRRAAWNGGFGGYTVWRSATTATSATFGGAKGATYCFSVRAHDTGGLTSAWTAETCTSVPLDDRSLSRTSAWSARTGTAYYARTYLLATRYGATLTRTGVVARRIALLVTTCRGCGTLRVYWRGRLIRTVSMASTTTVNRKLITVASFGSAQSGTLVLKVSTSGRRVIVDGLAIRRV